LGFRNGGVASEKEGKGRGGASKEKKGAYFNAPTKERKACGVFHNGEREGQLARRKIPTVPKKPCVKKQGSQGSQGLRTMRSKQTTNTNPGRRTKRGSIRRREKRRADSSIAARPPSKGEQREVGVGPGPQKGDLLLAKPAGNEEIEKKAEISACQSCPIVGKSQSH